MGLKESSKMMFALNIKHFVVLKFLTHAFSINYKQIIHIYRINWKERRAEKTDSWKLLHLSTL